MSNIGVRLISRILVFLVLFSVLSVCSILGERTPPSQIQVQRQKEKEEKIAIIQEKSSKLPYYSRLYSESDKSLYIKIVYALENFNIYVSDVPSNSSMVFNIYNSVINDYPEIFWVKKATFTTKMVNNKPTGYRLDFSYIDDRDKEKIQEKILLIDRIVEQIINDSVMYETDYEKAKAAYEFLIRNTIYDEKFSDQSMYSVLANGRGVCAGYARAYQHIMDKMDIESIFISGDLKQNKQSNDNSGFNQFSNRYGHAWNLVKIGDSWYHVDVTSGDSLSSNSIISYQFFCLTTNEIESTHIIRTPSNIP